jgi:hypothetical protein
MPYEHDNYQTTSNTFGTEGFRLIWQPIGEKPQNAAVANVPISDIEILNEDTINETAFTKANLKKQPDLLYVRFKLVHEGGNKNFDYFDKEELKAAAETPIHKHLNWEHGEPTIGTIYYAEFVDSEDGAAKGSVELSHIIAEAVVWKFRYPDYARKMIKRHANRTLAFSMEAYFTEAECSKCGAVFAAEDHPEGTYCDCLNKRFEQSNASIASKDTVFRKLKTFILGGSGVVEDPADVKAESLALAKNKEVRQLSDKIELTQAELDAKIKTAVQDALDKAAEDAKDSEVAKELTAAQAMLTEQKEALEKASETIELLTKERDEAKAETKALEDKMVSDARATERSKILEDAGYVAPEDEEEAQTAFAKFVNMSEDVFDLFVTTIKAGLPKEEESEEVPEKPAKTIAKRMRVPASGGVSKEKNKQSTAEQAADILVRL